MRPGLLFVTVAACTVCAALLVRQHVQERAAQARIDEALRPFNELCAKNDRELAEFKAEQAAHLKREEERIRAILDPWYARLRAAQQLYDRDAEIYGKEEATRRHQAGVYIEAVLEAEQAWNR